MTGAVIAAAAASFIGSVGSGITQADALKKNAKLAELKGSLALTQAKYDAATVKTQSQRKRMALFAQKAGMGVDPTQGSPLSIMGNLAADAASAAENTMISGRLKQAAYDVEAGQFRSQASSALSGSILRGIGTAAAIVGGGFASGALGGSGAAAGGASSAAGGATLGSHTAGEYFQASSMWSI